MAAASQYLQLNPNEISLFERLFSLVEDPGTGVATGAQVSGLFLTSGLPRPTLAAIWNISSAGKGGKLDKDGFFIGCRLISLAQKNLPVSQESLLVHRDVPLPVFHGSAQQFYPREQQQQSSFPAQTTQQINPNMAGASQIMPTMSSVPQMTVPPTAQINAMPGQYPSLPPSGMKPAPQLVSTAQQTRIMPPAPAVVQQSAAPGDYSAMPTPDPLRGGAQMQPSGMSSAAASRRTSIQTDSLWDISPEKRETYLKYFDQADADKDGFVNGKEAKTFFTMSKLSAAVLRDIWLLSDIDQDNRLNKEEFTIAMHLTMAVRMSGVPVPAQLPDPLMQYYNRQVQTSFHPSMSMAPANVPAPAPAPAAAPTQSSSLFTAATAQPTISLQPTTTAPTATAAQIANPDRSVAKAEYARQISSAKAQIEEQKIAIQGYQSRLPNYEEELQNLKAEAKSAEDTLANMTAERKQHQTAFEKIRNDIANAKSDLDSVNNKLSEEQNSINDYQEKVAQGTLQLEKLRQERDRLQKAVDDLKHQVQDKELAVVCLEQEMEDVRKQIDHINEVSSYQMQILSKVSSDHEDREKQLAELLASKTQLDRFKATASTAGTSSSSAPISPLKTAGTAEPIWATSSLNATPAVATHPLTNALVQEEFTFPEFNDDDFSNSPLKSAPVTGVPVPAIDLAKSSAKEPISAAPQQDSFKFAPEPDYQPSMFPLDTATTNFSWEAQPSNPVNIASSKTFEANPFEEDDWSTPIKTVSAASSGSGKLQSMSSQTQNAESISWPASDFSMPTATGNGDWAQF